MSPELEEIYNSPSRTELFEWLDRLNQKVKYLEGQLLSMEFDLRELRRKLPD